MSTISSLPLKYHPTTQPSLRIAILYESCQLSDIVCIDLLGNCSRVVLEPAVREFPSFAPMLEHAIDIEFLYVSSSLKQPGQTTPDMKIVPTHTYDSCPRDVDVMLIGGPLLSHRPEGSLRLMREVVELGKTTILTTCVGSLWLADSGVAKGRKVTTNRPLIPLARQLHPDVDWVDQRWVVDKRDGKGEWWTAGGAGCGVDMMCHYMKEHFHPVLAEASWSGIEFNAFEKDIGIEYSKPMVQMPPNGAQA